MSPHNILVIKLGAFGDFIQSLSLLKAIRKHHSKDQITLLTTESYKNLAFDCGYVDEVIIDQKPKPYEIRQLLALRQELLNGDFKRVYDLQNNDRTSCYFHLFPCKKRPEWVGAVKGASHRNSRKDRTKKHAFLAHKDSLAIAGITDIEIDDLSWIKSDLSKFNLPGSNIALIVPGSSPKRPEKRWDAKYFAEICNYITSKGITPVLIGTVKESNVMNEILSVCKDAVNLSGKTSVYDIALLARNAVFAVGNDTGPMHVIGLTGCKTLLIFSKFSNPDLHIPIGKNIFFIAEDNKVSITPEDVIKKMSEISL